MVNLRTIQQALHLFLQGKSSDIHQYVSGKTPKIINRRLAIYQDAYQLRLEENLRKQYPVLSSWLGAKKFKELALAYDQEFPPTDYAIRHYAKHLPAYFERRGDLFLTELAAFEWAMNTALDDSPDAILLTTEDFQKISPDVLLSVTFHFNPSLQLLLCHYDIAGFWQAAKQSKPLMMPVYSADEIFSVFIWRKDTLPYVRTVTPLEAELISAARAQKNFSDLCEIAAISLPEKAVDFVAQTVLRWLKDGWLAVE